MHVFFVCRLQQSDNDKLTSRLSELETSLKQERSDQSSTHEQYEEARRALESRDTELQKALAERDELTSALHGTRDELEAVKVRVTALEGRGGTPRTE